MADRPTAGWRARAKARRADRALERQFAYQLRKVPEIRGREPDIIDGSTRRAAALRRRLEAFRPIGDDSRVIEVGSGAHGYVFFLGFANAVGVDPLAEYYRGWFPAWQHRARTVAAAGEALPFEDGAFDLVISHNVVDHARDPAGIVRELVRVAAPGALIYFTVNVHHRVYDAASRLHGGWKALRLPGEIGPFADHTVHLTPAAAARLFDGLPVRRLSESVDFADASRQVRKYPPRHPGDLLKRLFFKNALYELIAVRE